MSRHYRCDACGGEYELPPATGVNRDMFLNGERNTQRVLVEATVKGATRDLDLCGPCVRRAIRIVVGPEPLPPSEEEETQ